MGAGNRPRRKPSAAFFAIAFCVRVGFADTSAFDKGCKPFRRRLKLRGNCHIPAAYFGNAVSRGSLNGTAAEIRDIAYLGKFGHIIEDITVFAVQTKGVSIHCSDAVYSIVVEV